MEKTAKRKKIAGKVLFYLLHLAGFILLGLVLKNFDWQQFGSMFSTFTAANFLAGFGMLVIVYLLKSLRWMLINRTFGVHLGYGTTLIFFLASGFMSVITPGRVGEFTKIWFLKRNTGTSATVATSSVVLDRVWDVLVLTLLGGAGAVMIFGGFRISPVTLAMITGLFLLALAVILFPGIVFVPMMFLFRRRSGLKADLEGVYHDWRKHALQLFVPGFGLTLAAFMALALIPLFFTTRLGQDVGLLHAVSAVSISNMLAFLPVTVAGFGTRELVFSEIWNMLNYSTEAAITISTAYFICNYLGSLVAGGLTYLVWFRKFSRQ